MIAGAGFAVMAWRLAMSRTRALYRLYPHRPAAAQFVNGPDAEYYRILDEAMVGWYDGRPWVDL